MSQITITTKQLSALNELTDEWVDGAGEMTLTQRWVDGVTHLNVTFSEDDSSFVGPWAIALNGTVKDDRVEGIGS